MAQILGANMAVRSSFFALVPAVAGAGAMGLPILLSLAGLSSARPSQIRQTIDRRPAWLLALFGLLAWLALSALWAPNHGWTAVKLAILIPAGLMYAAAARVDANAARHCLAAGLAAFLSLSALLAVEAFGDLAFNRAAAPDAPFLDLNRNAARGAVVHLALVWAPAAALLGASPARTAAGLAVLAIGGCMALQFGQASNTAAFILGVALLGVGFLIPRLAILATSGGLAIFLMAAPFLAILLPNVRDNYALPFSWAARIEIWRYTSAHVLERPWTGHGLDASRAVQDRLTVQGDTFRAMPLHPHSASLQLWYETGIVGAGLAALALALGGWSIAHALRNDRRGAACVAATLAALGLTANVSFSIWQEWWLATVLVAATLAAAIYARRLNK